MLRTKALRFACIFAATLVAAARADEKGVILPLTSMHSRFGRCTGVLEIRPRQRPHQGFEVNRVCTYADHRYEGFRVQEVWQGSAERQGSTYQVRFDLKQADIFNRVDGLERTPEQFTSPVSLSYAVNIEAPEDKDLTLPNGTVREHLLPPSGPAGTEPLWRSERRVMESSGTSFPWLSALAANTLFRPIMDAYARSPFVRRFSHRPEYQSKMQYFIIDPTDFEFLRQNPDTIRITNKVTDEISAFEAALRRDAYAPTLAEKAAAFDREFAHDHLNELGLYGAALLDANGRPAGTFPNGDGCLWTGMYAGSQAMRYLATRDPEALAGFKRTISGLMLLLDVTGDAREFGRTARLSGPQNLPSPGFKTGAAPLQQVEYIPAGNNDMIKGIYHGFAWAFLILPEDDPLRAQIKPYALRLTDLRIAREVNHPRNWLFAAGLRALASGDREWKRKYSRFHRMVITPIDLSGFDNGFYYGGIADWSGINLGMVSRITDILIANELAKAFPDDTYLPGVVNKSRRALMQAWAIYARSRRDIVTVAAQVFGVHAAALPYAPGVRAPQAPTDPRWADDVRDAVWSLREIPVNRAFHSAAFDSSLRPDFSVSAWPRLPWKYLRDEKDLEYFYQSAYDFPIFESEAHSSDNHWTWAFSIRGANAREIRHGRADYLFVYWMGRLVNLFDRD